MWPVESAITPCQGFRARAMVMRFVWVPPTRKYTSASGLLSFFFRVSRALAQ